jgi:hypothetical protein
MGVVSLASAKLADPTEPPSWRENPVYASAAAPVLSLTQIMISGSQASAVINDQTLVEGDFIKGYIITKIKPNVVYLKNANGALMLPLVSEPIKLTATTDRNDRDN